MRALAQVQEADVEGDGRIAEVMTCVGGLQSIAHQINTVSPFWSTTVCTVTKDANRKKDPSEVPAPSSCSILQYIVDALLSNYFPIFPSC